MLSQYTHSDVIIITSCIMTVYRLLVSMDILVGAIKTGCMKTPALKSRFCALHKPRAIDIKSIDVRDDVEGEVRNSSTPTTQQTSVIEVAVDKRVTRSDTTRYLHGM